MDAGLYISVPFCKAKCSFCNFASGVFAAERMDGYLGRVIEEMRGARSWAERLGGEWIGGVDPLIAESAMNGAWAISAGVDSIYLGGGTPSVLTPGEIRRLFGGVRGEFAVRDGAEITVECAPGQLSDESLEAFQRDGVNRLSFGVQSFVDAECSAVGRLHTEASCLAELRRVREAGVARVGVDLICGLPHQTFESWRYSVLQALESGVEHVSLYMLEVDEDSRLGRESMAGGTRYGAGALPDEDAVADWYAAACEWLAEGGVRQYEISNFARAGGESRHNRKYWERKPYLGFGLDAHSMLRAGVGGVRWANAGEMEGYVGRLGVFDRTVDRVGVTAAFEESLFLGLRLVEGVSLPGLRAEFGDGLVGGLVAGLPELAGLVGFDEKRVWLTSAGRMVSNEVFERVLVAEMA